jgi:peptidoglycan/LPS O-acetylase OafA/YrhL
MTSTLPAAAPPAPADLPRSSLDEVMAGRHLPALDGLRWVAVLVVMVYHFGWKAVPGDLGVSGFFVLSGFLITWLLLREHERTGTVSLKGFYLRRTLRIFPAYYVFVALCVAIDLARGDARVRPVILPALTYTVNYFNAFNGHPSNSMAHAWSLAVEEQFYLLWPFLFLLAIRAGRRGVGRVLVGIIGAVLLWRAWLYLGGHAGEAYVYNAFDTRFDNLAVGCLLAVLLTTPSVVRRVATLPMPAWSPLVTVALLVTSRALISDRWHYSVGFTVDAVLFAVLITQLLALHLHPAWRWLDRPAIKYLGLLSYPLYLYHGYGIGLARRVPVAEPLQLVLGIAASVAIAAGSYHLVEQRFLRLKERLQTR